MAAFKFLMSNVLSERLRHQAESVAVEVNPKSGLIRIVTSKSVPNEGELDQWMAKHARSTEGH